MTCFKGFPREPTAGSIDATQITSLGVQRVAERLVPIYGQVFLFLFFF